MNKSILIYGPQGCGKSQNADMLAKAFGLSKTLDGWDESQPFPQLDTLVLAQSRPRKAKREERRVMSYRDAMLLAKQVKS